MGSPRSNALEVVLSGRQGSGGGSLPLVAVIPEPL